MQTDAGAAVGAPAQALHAGNIGSHPAASQDLGGSDHGGLDGPTRWVPTHTQPLSAEAPVVVQAQQQFEKQPVATSELLTGAAAALADYQVSHRPLQGTALGLQ